MQIQNPTSLPQKDSLVTDQGPELLILNNRSSAWISNHVAALAEGKTPQWWWIAFCLSLIAALTCLVMIAYLMTTGIGVWGLNHPVAWAWDITNFVFWIGIGHAGTLISAILFLMRQKWRASINRAAEAMTLFAVLCAGIFPFIHMGRAWLAWWLLPIPNSTSVWPQFRSPLEWDIFAVGTYFTVSVLFWYTGMIPDLAMMRDRASTRSRNIIFGLMALGWRWSHRHWHHYQKAYLLLAGLSTPLVLSVHSIVSLDFAVAQLPGWHSTIFPPYFVAGAIFSGFAVVLTLMIPLRSLCHLEDIITPRHFDAMCKVVLATSSMVGYAYVVEFFGAWYSQNDFERSAFYLRATGVYAWAFWPMLFFNVALPQLLWSKKVRKNTIAVFLIAIGINVGMWLERFVIIAGTLAADFMPANWRYFTPTYVDVLTFVGSCGLFCTLFLLFIRFLPMIAVFEVKHLRAGSSPDTASVNVAKGGGI